MARIRYRANRQGLREMLGADWVGADLARRADRVAAAVRRDYKARPPHSGQVTVLVSSESAEIGGRLRARAAVIAQHPAVMHIEADRRPLASALDAANIPARKPRKKKPKAG